MKQLFFLLQRVSLGLIFVAVSVWGCRSGAQTLPETPAVPIAYYIDSENGNDQNVGTSEATAWKTLVKAEKAILKAGDSIRFKRSSNFTGPFYIRYSGNANHPIVITDYGDQSKPAPRFTNSVFKLGNYGNCIRAKGSYVVIENLHCFKTSAYVRGEYTPTSGWDTTVWEMGAIYIDKEALHCIVRNNEIEDCVVGIKSYGPFALIQNNYIHDCNRVLKEWGWGPLGIWLGADEQEASYNRIFNYSAVDPRIVWGEGIGGGADGGAFEIDDARYNKSHIAIHHNYTRDCQGFLEVTWTDIQQHPSYNSFDIHHNVSDDYQQFIALWQGGACKIDNNTIIRRKKNVNDWGVFNITQNNSNNLIRNNIIITEGSIPIFNTGLSQPHQPRSIIENNLFFAASGLLVMANEGPGTEVIYGDPFLKNYNNGNKPEDFAPLKGSIAIDRGKPLGNGNDFFNKPVKGLPDVGAIESLE